MAKKKFKKQSADPKTDGVSMADLIAMADYLKQAKYKNEVAQAILAKICLAQSVQDGIKKEAAFWLGYMRGTTALISTGTMLPSVGQEVQAWVHDERRFGNMRIDSSGEWLERVAPQVQALIENATGTSLQHMRYPKTAVTYWFVLPGQPLSDYADEEKAQDD